MFNSKDFFIDLFFDKTIFTFWGGITIAILAIISMYNIQIETIDEFERDKSIALSEVVPNVNSVCVEAYVDDCLTLIGTHDALVIATRDKFAREEQYTVYVKPKKDYD